jgi:hypothetical protein
MGDLIGSVPVATSGIPLKPQQFAQLVINDGKTLSVQNSVPKDAERFTPMKIGM